MVGCGQTSNTCQMKEANLKGHLLRDSTQANILNRQVYGQKAGEWQPRAGVEAGVGVTGRGYGVSFQGPAKVLQLQVVVSPNALNCHRTIQVKMVHFALCEFNHHCFKSSGMKSGAIGSPGKSITPLLTLCEREAGGDGGQQPGERRARLVMLRVERNRKPGQCHKSGFSDWVACTEQNKVY